MLCHNSILLQIQCFITSSHFTCRMTEQLQISLVHTPTPSRKACSDCAPCWIVIRRVLWEQTQMEEHREKSARREGGGCQTREERKAKTRRKVCGWMNGGGGWKRRAWDCTGTVPRPNQKLPAGWKALHDPRHHTSSWRLAAVAVLLTMTVMRTSSLTPTVPTPVFSRTCHRGVVCFALA